MTRERVLAQFGVHPLHYLGVYIIAALFTATIIGIVIAIPIVLITEFVRRGHTFVITDKRLLHRYKFLSKKSSSVYYAKVTDVHLTQGVMQRILGIGTVHINTAGTDATEMVYFGIKDPTKIKNVIGRNLVKR